MVERGEVWPYYLARAYAARGDEEEAMVWLKSAYQKRDPYMLSLKVDPWFDDLRSNPGMTDMLRRMNFLD